MEWFTLCAAHSLWLLTLMLASCIRWRTMFLASLTSCLSVLSRRLPNWMLSQLFRGLPHRFMPCWASFCLCSANCFIMPLVMLLCAFHFLYSVLMFKLMPDGLYSFLFLFGTLITLFAMTELQKAAVIFRKDHITEGEVLDTFTILTTRCSASLEWLHDRMPVIFRSPSSSDAWLDTTSTQFGSLLLPYEGSDLVWYPVTPAMGRNSFDGPECIKEIKPKIEENQISKLFSKKAQKTKTKGNLDAESHATYKKHFPDASVSQSLKDINTMDNISEGVDTCFTSVPENVKTGIWTKEEREPSGLNCYKLDSGNKSEKCNVKRELELSQTDSRPHVSDASKVAPSLKRGKHEDETGNAPHTIFYYFKSK